MTGRLIVTRGNINQLEVKMDSENFIFLNHYLYKYSNISHRDRS